MGRSNLLLKMELLSNPETLCAVRGALGQLAEKLGFSEPECRAIVLAVDEALTNIIRHAYGGDTDKPIEAYFRRVQDSRNGTLSEALEIVLEDRGVAVDGAKLCGRALEDVKPGGLGLHFIHQSMDKVEFRRKIGRNQVRLVKFILVSEPRKGS
jgi:anti-sigma regulatory factor (Ser/Thr protein kinase)